MRTDSDWHVLSFFVLFCFVSECCFVLFFLALSTLYMPDSLKTKQFNAKLCQFDGSRRLMMQANSDVTR